MVTIAIGAAAVPSGAGAAPSDPSGDLPHIRPLIDQTLETEKSGIEVRWSNPATGNRGMMRVERTFYRDGRPCREYIRTVERSSGSGWVIRGTACRAERARWEIRNEVPTETGSKERARARPRPATTGAKPAAAVEPEGGGPQPTSPELAAGPAPDAGETSTEPAAGGARSEAKAAATEEEPFVAFTRPARTGI